MFMKSILKLQSYSDVSAAHAGDGQTDMLAWKRRRRFERRSEERGECSNLV